MKTQRNDLLIRELRAEDAGTLLEYLKQVGGETDNLTFGAEGLPVTLEEEQRFLASVHDGQNSFMLGVFRDGKLIGQGSLIDPLHQSLPRVELGLTVLKEEWNRGIGSLLLEELIAFAKQAGVQLIYLEVRSDNAAAIHLYEKYRFRHVETLPAYIKTVSGFADFDLMILDLRQEDFVLRS